MHLPPIPPIIRRIKPCLSFEGAVEGCATGKAGIESDGFEGKVVVGRVGKEKNGVADTKLIDIGGERFATDRVDGFRNHVAMHPQALRNVFEVDLRVKENLFRIDQMVQTVYQSHICRIGFGRRDNGESPLRPLTAGCGHFPISLLFLTV